MALPGLSPNFNYNALNFITASQPITICSAASIVIRGDTEVPVPDTYSWEVLQGGTWINAPGTNNTADYPPLLLVNTTSSNILFSIRRKYITGGITNYDSYYDVTVLPSSPVTNNTLNTPATNSFCSPGQPAAITGSTPAGGDGNIGYQWQSSADNVNFTNITGANSITYTPPQLTVTTYYRRTVTAGSCVAPSLSNTIGIVIIQQVTNNLVTAPTVNVFCSASDPAAITGNVPTGGNGTYTYQWQVSADNANFSDIAGATNKDYDPATINATTYYRRAAISGVCSVPVYSNDISISILPALTNNSLTAPAVTNFCVNGDAANIAGSTPAGGNGTFAYQWQRSVDNVNFTDVIGATAKDYDPPFATISTYYRRAVTSIACNTPLISNVIAINMLVVPVAPTVSQTAVTVCPGSAATLVVSAPQAGFTYNWYDSPAKTTLLFTGTSYTTAPQTINKLFYAESSNGTCASSSVTTIQVLVATPPAAPALASSTVTTCSGSSAALSVSGAQAGFTYSWYLALSGGSPVGTGTNFTTPALSANAVYYVEAVNPTGCTSASRAAVTVNINALPQVNGTGSLVCPGSTATLTATADPGTTINWYANSTGGGTIATGGTFTTPPLSGNVNYYVEAVNNTTGCVSAARKLVQAGLLQPLPAPVVKAGTATESSVTFGWDAITGAIAYQVSVNGGAFADPSSGSSGLSHIVTGLHQSQTVSIVVRALGASGCQLSGSSVAVIAKAESQTDEIFVANAFTPNGDGKNDFVYVHSEGIKSLNFYVYDQWGEMIYNTADIANGWDGTFKGMKEPAGVYVYYVKAVMNNGHTINKKGTITLLR